MTQKRVRVRRTSLSIMKHKKSHFVVDSLQEVLKFPFMIRKTHFCKHNRLQFSLLSHCLTSKRVVRRTPQWNAIFNNTTRLKLLQTVCKMDQHSYEIPSITIFCILCNGTYFAFYSQCNILAVRKIVKNVAICKSSLMQMTWLLAK